MNTTDFLEWLQASIPLLILIFFLYAIWVSVWKGIALWKAAQAKSVPWFIVLFIFNTLGILEILYIFIFSKMGTKETEKKD